MGKYDDIISLSHPVSKTKLAGEQNALSAETGNQDLSGHAFSSFAALTGYEEIVAERARLTETRAELDRDALEALDEKLRAVAAEIDARPELELRYFVPDKKKAGGRYETIRGCVKKIDGQAGLLILTDGKKVPLGDIVSIEKL